MEPFHHRLTELHGLVSGSDMSLATRRLMDVCDEYPELRPLRAQAATLRADYNMGREPGAIELSGEQATLFTQRARQLYTSIAAQPVADPTSVATASTVFRCHGLTKQYSSGKHQFALGPIDLELRTGSITGLVGENGNGKTTLLRTIAGLLQPDGGNWERPGTANDPRTIRQHIAWIPQRSVPWNGTLLQNLHFTAATHGIRGQANSDRVEYTLHRLGLTRFKDLTWKQLSSGYKLRFELARMVVWHPRVLVLDEPIANLDLQAQQLFLQDLKHLAASQAHPLSVIMSSQQLHEIEAIADHIIFLKNGIPVYNGATNAFDTGRESNVFEIKATLDRERFLHALGADTGILLEDTGLLLRLTTPRALTAREVLKALAAVDAELAYFRDISTSTRKLFHQDT